ncbi:hypothetical protein BH23GEM6_BH23GEM6_26310 [soil metagenome]
MLPAPAQDMRLRAIAVCLLLSGCERGGTTLSGTVAEGENLTHVWKLGSDQRGEIVGDSFFVADITSDVVELRFARGDNEVGGMELREIARGVHLRLRGIAFEDGVAFPASVEGAQAAAVVVNGVRIGNSAGLPNRVDVQGILLSRSRTGDALLIRPDGDQLPDLRVVVTPATEVRRSGGETASLERTDFGDSLRIVGPVEDGFVIATGVELLARSGAGEGSSTSSSTPSSESPSGPARAVTTPSSSPPGREQPAAEAEAERERGKQKRQGRGPPPERGRRRGN